MAKESTLTIKFRGKEAEILEALVKEGIFNKKTEAVRSALIKYAIDLGYFSRKQLWKTIESYPRRNVTKEKLKKDLERLENEA